MAYKLYPKISVVENGQFFVGGDFVDTDDFITAPDPNNYGREIVIGERPKKACPYCRNTSGLKDSRCMCVSCGGNMEEEDCVQNGRAYPSPFADWRT